VVRVVENGDVSKEGRKRRSARRWLGFGLGAAALATALATELRKPAGEPTWHGRIAGTVPYDLRPPTLARVHERLWNTADRRILVPTVFGVGWTVNLGQLLERLQGRITSN
jgi:hypothetical protein